MKLAPKKYNRVEQLKKCNRDLRKRINKANKKINEILSKPSNVLQYIDLKELKDILQGSDKK